jgi:hypothetical protein
MNQQSHGQHKAAHQNPGQAHPGQAHPAQPAGTEQPRTTASWLTAKRNEAVLGPFTVRDVTVFGSTLILFVASLIPMFEVRYNLWNLGSLFFLGLGIILPLIVAALFVARRLTPESKVRIGSLSVDQFASVVASFAVAFFFLATAGDFVPTMLVGLIGSLGLFAATVLARFIPFLAGDFLDRAESPAHVVARESAVPFRKPSAPKAPQTAKEPTAGLLAGLRKRLTARGAAGGAGAAGAAAVAGAGSNGDRTHGAALHNDVTPAVVSGAAEPVPYSVLAPDAQPSSSAVPSKSAAPTKSAAPKNGALPSKSAVPSSSATAASPATQAAAVVPPAAEQTQAAEQTGAVEQAQAAAVAPSAPNATQATVMPGSPGAAGGSATAPAPGVTPTTGATPAPAAAASAAAVAAAAGSAASDPAATMLHPQVRSQEPIGATVDPSSRPEEHEDQPVHEAFWFAVAQPRTAVDEHTGAPAFVIEPGGWVLALEDRGHEFLVQHTDGRLGVLHDLSNIERG